MDYLLETTKVDIKLDALVPEQNYDNEEKEEDEVFNEPGQLTKLRDDKWNIMLLLFLYLLQGIPIGLAISIPLILQQKKISYKEQSLFSLISWPFSLKLLWAPIVDSFYWNRIGRRKSWLISVQYITGITMIILSKNISSLLGDDDSEPRLFLLFLAFLFLYFLAATQDIAVDGWALSILSRKNIGYASSCNVIGATAGIFIGKVLFLALESAEFCNTYLRSEPSVQGIVTLSSFLKLWGYTFCVLTTGILIFKKEKERNEGETFLNIKDTYKLLYQIFCLPSMKMTAVVYMTSYIGFTLTDYVIDLKLVESGVPKEHLAMLDIPILPITMLVPLFIRRHVVGPHPLNIVLKLYPYRLLFGIIFAFLLWWTRSVKAELGRFPVHFYMTLLSFFIIYKTIRIAMITACIAFHTKISDPFIGGTYMTLMNTLANLGSHWPSVIMLWWMDPLTHKECRNFENLTCNTKELMKSCTQAGGHCVTTVDGYYILTVLCIIFGYLWFKWGKPAVIRLQQLPLSSWTY